MRAWLLLALLLLAGCTDAPKEEVQETPDDGDPLTEGERDLRIDLLANDTLQAPTWAVGDRYEYAWSGYGVEASFGAVVTADENGNFEVWADDAEAAAWQSAFDYNLLGSFAGGTLSTTYYFELFKWYDFPLSEGKTWDGKINSLENPYEQWLNSIFDNEPPTEFPVTYTATYAEALDTPMGDRPGFQITANYDGSKLVEYDYAPAVGWFTHYAEYRNGPDAAPTVEITLRNYERNWTGTAYKGETEQATDYFYVVAAVPPDPSSPGLPEVIFTGNLPTDEFDTDGDLLLGFVISGAVGGHSDLRVMDSTNTERAASSTSGLPPDFYDEDQQVVLINDPTGRWRTMIAGAGAGYGGGTWLWNVDMSEVTL